MRRRVDEEDDDDLPRRRRSDAIRVLSSSGVTSPESERSLRGETKLNNP